MTGKKINNLKYPPSSLVQIFSPEDWEDFIEESCRARMNHGDLYCFVARIGGAGDAGRDVEARYTPTLSEGCWDLYQAKHYNSAIGESVLYPELAKFFHHLSLGTYPAPKYYFVCAPKNTSPKLHDLIAAPEKLKTAFMKSWQEGKNGIKLKDFPLTQDVVSAVAKFDFGNIKEMPVKDLIAYHSLNSSAHECLFGIEALRGANPVMPPHPAKDELMYIAQLVMVYSEDAGELMSMGDVLASSTYGDHLESCRGEFYSAEGLRRFSRDVMPGEFENLLIAVHDGVRRLNSSPKELVAFEKVEKVLQAAAVLQVANNPLSNKLLPADLPGACHHLVNEEKLKWLK